MSKKLYQDLSQELIHLESSGLYKHEREITSVQQAAIHVKGQAESVINLCANNYLGLASHPEVIRAAVDAVQTHGFGTASVRFICGTQDVHRDLEQRLSEFLGTEETILYSSCFDANGGLFETFLTADDAIISDALNHASIIDGIRLCKAQRLRYDNNDMQALEQALQSAAAARYRVIATDGVFSMDGSIANLPAICDLAERYDALVMVDDSHAVGFMGAEGRGTHEFHHVMDRIDIITGTLGKALGGASGGYTAGKKRLVNWLRNRSRPYLFSNSLSPVVAAVTLKILDMVQTQGELRAKLWENTAYFRQGLAALGFDVVPGEHPIIPVMLGDAKLASQMADALLAEGIYVIGFSYPVVPQGKARIRTQMSAGLSREQLTIALDAFAKIGRELGVIR